MLLLGVIWGLFLPYMAAGVSLPMSFMGLPGPARCGMFQEFRRCGPTCPPNCDTLKETVCCEVDCITGCFCADGYILEKDPKTGPTKCIPLDQCPSPGVIAFERPTLSVLEGSGKAIITVVRLNGSYSPISCRYRVIGPVGPYAGMTGELEFPDGVVARTIEIPLQDNAVRDPDLTIRLELFEPSRKTNILTGTFVLTILDDDMTPGYLELEQTDFNVPESVGSARIQVIRREGSDGQLRVKYRTVPDTASTNVDFSPVTGELIFEEGETSQTVAVSIVDDEVREAKENFKIEFFDFTHGPGVLNFRRRGSVLTADVTIVDNDMKPGILQLERTSYNVQEDTRIVEVVVIRLDGQDGQIKVRFETNSKTAIPGQDFESQTGMLIFEEGELRKTIRIKILDDSVREPEETFEVLLLDATPGPGTINFRGLGSNQRARITIIDDDMNPGVLQLERSTYEVMEDVGSVRVDVVRSGGQDGRIVVQYQTKDLTAKEKWDFVAASGELIFEEGETRKSIVVQINDDTEKEPLETLEVQLFNPTPGPGIIHFRGFGSFEKAIIKIRDNDMTPGILVLEKDSYGVTESVGILQISVVRLDGMDGQIRVHYQTVSKTATAGKDFESVSGDLIFEAGETVKVITIRILNDDIREPSKYFEIQLTDPTPGSGVINFRGLGSIPAAVITIEDDDMRPGILQFESSTYDVLENVGTLKIRVVRQHGTDGEIRVKYRTVPSTAVMNQDFVYTEGEVVFNEGDPWKEITIQIIDDEVREPIKVFQVKLLNPTPGLGVINFEGLGPLQTTVVTITDDDMRPGSFVLENPSYDILESGGTVTIGVVRVDGSDGQIRVKYRTVPKSAQVNQDFVPSEGELVFEEDHTRKDIVIQIVDDNIREPNKIFEVQLLDPTPGLGVINFRRFISIPKAVVTIIDDDMKPGILKFEDPSYEVYERERTVKIGVVRLDGTDGEIRVKYKTIAKTAQVNQDFAYTEGELVFGERESRKDITIQIVDDDVREITKAFEVQLLDLTPGVGVINFRRFTSNPTAVVSILDDDMKPGILKFENPSYEVYERERTVKIGVVRLDGTDGVLRVKYKTIAKTAQVNQDFAYTEGELVFGERESRKDITIQIVDDDVREITKAFEVQLLDLTPGLGVINFRRFTSNPTAVVSILDDDMKPGTLTFENPSYEVYERERTVKIGVVRLDGADGEIRVKYETIWNTALVNQDFVHTEGELVFREGENRKDITIQIVDDDVREITKTFEVQLLDLTPGLGVINFRRFTSNPKAVVTILDDDMKPGTFQLEKPSFEFLESVGTIKLTVVRVYGTDGEIRVKYKTIPKTAQVNQDFIPTEGVLVFGEKETRKDIIIQIVDDDVREPTKTFEVQLFDPLPAVGVINFRRFVSNPTAIVSIIDDDMRPGIVQLERHSYEVVESVGTLKIGVVRVDGQDGEIRVQYRTVAVTALVNQDFVYAEGELVFLDGEIRKYITIQIFDDDVREPEKTFEVQLVDPRAGPGVINFKGLGLIKTTVVTITDDDMTPGSLEIEQSSYIVEENVGQVQIGVIRLDGKHGQIRVRYRTVPRTAAAQTDFLPVEGELIFDEGEDRKFIVVQILNDNVKESLEMFEVQLLQPTAGQGVINFRGLGPKTTAVVTIRDDDITPGYLELDRSTYFVTESVGVVQVVVVRRGGTDGQIRCHYQSRPKSATTGTDFTPIQGELVFEHGESSKVITVQILDDRVRESRESFEIVLMEPGQERVLGEIQTTEVVIDDDDMRPGFLELDETSYVVSESVGTLNVVVRRVDGSDGQIRVGYVTTPKTALPGFDFTPTKGELIFEEGDQMKTIHIQIRDDNQKEPSENFEIQLLDPETGLNFRNQGQKQKAVVTINDDDWTLGFFELEQASYEVVETVGTLSVGVIRLGGSDGQVRIRYQTVPKTAQPSSDFQPTSGELVFEDGETKKTIHVSILNDGIREPAETFEIQLLDPTPPQGFINFRGLGQKHSAVVTIFDDDGNPGFLELEEPTYVVSEGIRTLRVIVNRRGGHDGRIQCRYQTTAKTALAGIDFEPGSGELIFEDGETRKIISIQIVNDKVKESIKSFEVQLLDPLPAPGIVNFGVVGSRRRTLVTIADDDTNPGLVQMEIPSFTVKESVGTIHIPVIRVNGSDGQIRVRYQAVSRTAQEGVDFNPLSGDLVFEDGENRKIITLQIMNDRMKEPAESFEVRLMDPTPGPGVLNFRGLGFISQSVITILDDDMNHGFLELESPSYHFSEDSGTASIGVIRLDGTDGRIHVRYQTIPKTAIPGKDYIETSGELVFEEGVRRKDIAVQILNDHRKEATKTFEVQLFEPAIEGEEVSFRALGLKSITLVSIWDDDHNPGVFQFRDSQVTVREGSAKLSLTIIRTDGTDGSVTVRLRTVDSSARLGEDYTIRDTLVSFGDGEREKTVHIDIIDDNIPEGTEHFKVGLFDPSNGAILGQTSIFAVTILDNDGFVDRPSVPASQGTEVFFPVTSVTVPRGSRFARFKVRREGPWIPLKVFLETLDGTAVAGVDYKRTLGEIPFKPNEIELTVTLNLIDNPNQVGSRSFKVRISNPSSGVVVRGRDLLTIFIGAPEGTSSVIKTTFHQHFETSVPSSGRSRTDGSLGPVLPPRSSPPQGQRQKPPRGQQDCEPGLIYKECFIGCPQVCNLVADPVCQMGCVPACVCPSGTILESLHSSKCVQPSQCPRGGGRVNAGGLLGGGGGNVGGLIGGGGGGGGSAGGLLNGVGGNVGGVLAGGGGSVKGVLGGGGGNAGGLLSGVGGNVGGVLGGGGGGGNAGGLLSGRGGGSMGGELSGGAGSVGKHSGFGGGGGGSVGGELGGGAGSVGKLLSGVGGGSLSGVGGNVGGGALRGVGGNVGGLPLSGVGGNVGGVLGGGGKNVGGLIGGGGGGLLGGGGGGLLGGGGGGLLGGGGGGLLGGGGGVKVGGGGLLGGVLG